MSSPPPLQPDQLIHRCERDRLDFDSTEDLEPLPLPPGQERAVGALEFGTDMPRQGYNLFVMGSPGVGKHHLINTLLEQRAADEVAPPDWCYVFNFDAPDQPAVLELPSGMGQTLRNDLEQLIEDLINAIAAAFQNDEYRRRFQEVQDEFEKREDDAAAALGKKARERDIALLSTPTGYSLAPMHDDKVLSDEEYEALPEQKKTALQADMERLKKELRDALGQIPLWQREMHQRIRELDSDISRLTVETLILALKKRYQDLPRVLDHFNALCDDVVEHVALFRSGDEEESPERDDSAFTRYRVNLLINNRRTEGAPVITEDNPSYQNLMGRIEHIARNGTLMTDFTLIKPGALHRANGGYLVVDAEKVVDHDFAWDALKRALIRQEIRIEPLEHVIGLTGTVSLEPQPIDLKVKVVLVGERFLYYLLKTLDPEFSALFKVQADFAEDMPRSPRHEHHYARLIATLQRRDKLRPFDRLAVGELIDWSARRAGDGEKLSLHLGDLVGLLAESDFLATRAGSARVTEQHVRQAIDARIHRADRVGEQIRDAILRGIQMIDTKGWQLGQVNGLAVVEIGDQIFGSPTRISATARLGEGDVVDVQRETELGGAIHSKGVLILSAYLGYRYARNLPLALSASLVFEQTYEMIEGDSASLAELCALLSAIGDVAIDQRLAVTGSVNQHGQVQAIGAVNEKIEGFFDICRARGLEGGQAGIIPRANTKDLMLREDVRQAVADGRFAIHAVDHVDQAMALLTGMTPGVADATGHYPPDTVNGRIQQRLVTWTAMRQHYAAHGPGSD